MSNITAQMVKELRDRTGAGMMECKKALKEASADTFLGAIIMFPLSVIIIKTCIDYFGTSSEFAAFMNFLSLTIIAIIRKALVRLHFSKWD